MLQRAGLHRADLVAAFSEIPRCPGARESHHGPAGRQEIQPHHRQALPWESWAAPKDKSGKLDHNHALTGDDLLDFVNRQLFPYLHGFKAKASGPTTIEYKIGEIFSEIKNRI